AGRDREAPCVGRDDEARAVSGHARQNRGTAGRGDDTTRRRARVRAPGRGPGLEGHRREPARGSWDVDQWAGSGKTQVTRQDRASCGLDTSNESLVLRLACWSRQDGTDATKRKVKNMPSTQMDVK